MPTNRSFLIAASSMLALLLSSSAFGQSPAFSPIDPWLADEAELDAMDAGEFARRYAVETALIQSYQQTFERACADPLPGCDPMELDDIQACLELADNISDALLALGEAKAYYEARHAPAPAPPEPVTANPPPNPSLGEAVHTLVIPNTATFTTEFLTIEAVLGSRDEFIVTCSNNQTTWEAAYDAALILNKGVLEMPARAPTMARWAKVPTEDTNLQTAMDDSMQRLAEVSVQLQGTQAQSQAARPTLERYQALGDFGPNSCGELYDFAFETDARHTLMSMAVSDVAIVSTLIVNERDDRDAADRHWETLNNFIGGWLFGPTHRDDPTS